MTTVAVTQDPVRQWHRRTTPCVDCGAQCSGDRCRPCEVERRRTRPYLRQSNGDPKVLAQWCVKTAIRSGRLTRQPCEVCGGEPSDAHHTDYDRPYDVTWLCRKHHREAHMPTHCINGHEFTPENTRKKGTRRLCRACQRHWTAAYRRRLKEKLA